MRFRREQTPRQKEQSEGGKDHGINPSHDLYTELVQAEKTKVVPPEMLPQDMLDESVRLNRGQKRALKDRVGSVTKRNLQTFHDSHDVTGLDENDPESILLAKEVKGDFSFDKVPGMREDALSNASDNVDDDVLEEDDFHEDGYFAVERQDATLPKNVTVDGATSGQIDRYLKGPLHKGERWNDGDLPHVPKNDGLAKPKKIRSVFGFQLEKIKRERAKTDRKKIYLSEELHGERKALENTANRFGLSAEDTVTREDSTAAWREKQQRMYAVEHHEFLRREKTKKGMPEKREKVKYAGTRREKVDFTYTKNNWHGQRPEKTSRYKTANRPGRSEMAGLSVVQHEHSPLQDFLRQYANVEGEENAEQLLMNHPGAAFDFILKRKKLGDNVAIKSLEKIAEKTVIKALPKSPKMVQAYWANRAVLDFDDWRDADRIAEEAYERLDAEKASDIAAWERLDAWYSDEGDFVEDATSYEVPFTEEEESMYNHSHEPDAAEDMAEEIDRQLHQHKTVSRQYSQNIAIEDRRYAQSHLRNRGPAETNPYSSSFYVAGRNRKISATSDPKKQLQEKGGKANPKEWLREDLMDLHPSGRHYKNEALYSKSRLQKIEARSPKTVREKTLYRPERGQPGEELETKRFANTEDGAEKSAPGLGLLEKLHFNGLTDVRVEDIFPRLYSMDRPKEVRQSEFDRRKEVIRTRFANFKESPFPEVKNATEQWLEAVRDYYQTTEPYFKKLSKPFPGVDKKIRETFGLMLDWFGNVYNSSLDWPQKKADSLTWDRYRTFLSDALYKNIEFIDHPLEHIVEKPERYGEPRDAGWRIRRAKDELLERVGKILTTTLPYDRHHAEVAA